jgi:hydroxymethylpyrimidine/phosphomethylpyrimidine kinase
LPTASQSASDPKPPGKPPIALSIAGFDPSSGAGITADLQVFAAHGLFGTSAITALTVQSTLGVAAVHPVDPQLLRHTLAHLTADLPPAGIKIGMLGTAGIANEIANFLENLKGTDAPGNPRPIVLDPVLLSSSGAALLDRSGLAVLRNRLLSLVTWITPNWAELAVLAQTEVKDQTTAREAADHLASRHPHLHIVATGGDLAEPTELFRQPSGAFQTFPGKRIATTSTHGTGCAFSSALLSRLVLGDSPEAAVSAAKLFVEAALRQAPGLGSGRGPLHLHP